MKPKDTTPKLRRGELQHQIVMLAWEQLQVPQPTYAARRACRSYYRMALDAFDSMGWGRVVEGEEVVTPALLKRRYEAVREGWKRAGLK